MSKSISRKRRESYFDFPEAMFRKAVYSMVKSLQSQGVKIPQNMQDFIDHCDKVKRDIPKPKKE